MTQDELKGIVDSNMVPIDYSEKDIAKQFGAKWDATKKSWYFIFLSDYEDFINYE